MTWEPVTRKTTPWGSSRLLISRQCRPAKSPRRSLETARTEPVIKIGFNPPPAPADAPSFQTLANRVLSPATEAGKALAAAGRHATLYLHDCAHVCWEPERLPLWAELEAFLRRTPLLPASVHQD